MEPSVAIKETSFDRADLCPDENKAKLQVSAQFEAE